MLFRHYKQTAFLGQKKYGIVFYDSTLDILFGLHVFVITKKKGF
jgi:hypothetical protein